MASLRQVLGRNCDGRRRIALSLSAHEAVIYIVRVSVWAKNASQLLIPC
jgi:hypothetical protein